MIRRRHLAPAAAAAAAALLLAGCGGGGGGGAAADDSAALPSASLPVATGAGPAESASLAIAALGTPGAVDASGSGATLASYDSFGVPHDAFAQQVDPAADNGSEADTGGSGGTAVTTDPLVGVPIGDPGMTAPGTATTPGTGPATDVPVQTPRALEADFDISGEPVVAREGDAIPPDTQQFVVETIAAESVVLKLSGGLLPDGSDTITLKEGQSTTLYNATAKRSYKIKLLDVRAA